MALNSMMASIVDLHVLQVLRGPVHDLGDGLFATLDPIIAVLHAQKIVVAMIRLEMLQKLFEGLRGRQSGGEPRRFAAAVHHAENFTGALDFFGALLRPPEDDAGRRVHVRLHHTRFIQSYLLPAKKVLSNAVYTLLVASLSLSRSGWLV